MFARLAPEGYDATTIAAWFFAAFGGNLLGGALGMLWSVIGHTAYFALMAAVAVTAGLAGPVAAGSTGGAVEQAHVATLDTSPEQHDNHKHANDEQYC